MTCKHCGAALNPEGTLHAEGPQRGLHRCAVDPYGYEAEAEDTPCSIACLGSTPLPPPITKVYR